MHVPSGVNASVCLRLSTALPEGGAAFVRGDGVSEMVTDDLFKVHPALFLAACRSDRLIRFRPGAASPKSLIPAMLPATQQP